MEKYIEKISKKKQEFHDERELYKKHGLRTEFNTDKPITVKNGHLLHNECILGEGEYTCVKQMIYAAALELPAQKQIIM